MNFILEQSSEILNTQTGLAIVGPLLSSTSLYTRLNDTCIPKAMNPYIKHSDVVGAYLGLLCQGKNDYEPIEEYRDNPFFKMALGIDKVPSCSILRQRLDQAGNRWNSIVREESALLLKMTDAQITPCIRDLIPLDIDVSPFDNSNTKKEGVSLTYKKVDGYAPIFSYLGEEGYCINTELREGKTHCQKNTDQYLAQSIRFRVW